MTHIVDPHTLAGLACELRVNLRASSPFLIHYPCVACGPLQDRMEEMIREPDPLAVGARMVVASLNKDAALLVYPVRTGGAGRA